MAQFKKEKLNMLQFKLAQLNMAQFNWKKTKYGTVQGSKLAKCCTVVISKLAKYRTVKAKYHNMPQFQEIKQQNIAQLKTTNLYMAQLK